LDLGKIKNEPSESSYAEDFEEDNGQDSQREMEPFQPPALAIPKPEITALKMPEISQIQKQ